VGCIYPEMETWGSEFSAYFLGQVVPVFEEGSDGSDTAKFLEAACYALIKRDDADLRRHVEEQIEWIRTSQWDDGYVNSYFTLIEPQNRFTNLRYRHQERWVNEQRCA
jgi:DUF1680 family protein